MKEESGHTFIKKEKEDKKERNMAPTHRYMRIK